MMKIVAGDNPLSSMVFAPPTDLTESKVLANPDADIIFGAYDLLGDVGPVTADAFAHELRIASNYAQSWLTWQTALEFVHRDEFGRYATFCALPRGLY